MPPRPPWPVPGFTPRALPPRRRRQWTRQFHLSAVRRNADDQTPGQNAAAKHGEQQGKAEDLGKHGRPEQKEGQDGAESNGKITELEDKLRAARKDAVQYASQLDGLYGPRGRRQGRRSSRQNVVENATAAAPVEIPQWFIDRNVTPHRDLPTHTMKDLADLLSAESISLPPLPRSPQAHPAASIDKYTYAELLFALAASFRLADPGLAPSFFAAKANLGLLVPVEGALPWLQGLVEELAGRLGAGVLRLDALDLMEIGSNILPKGGAGDHPIRALSYEVYQEEGEEEYEEEDGEGGEEEAEAGPVKRDFMVVKDLRGQSARDLMSMFSGKKPVDLNSILAGATPVRLGEGFQMQGAEVVDLNVSAENQRIHAMLDAMLEAAWIEAGRGVEEMSSAEQGAEKAEPSFSKRQAVDEAIDGLGRGFQAIGRDAESFTKHMSSCVPNLLKHIAEATQPSGSQRLIVCVSDVTNLSNAPLGDRIFSTLSEIVRRRRANGQQITIVGLSEGSSEGTETAESTQKQLDGQSRGSLFRVLFTPPDIETPPRFKVSKSRVKMWNHELVAEGETGTKDPSWDSINSLRKAYINLRHIRDMCKRLLPSDCTFDLPSQQDIPPALFTVLESARVLTPEEVHNIAMTVVGVRALTPTDRNDVTLAELVFAISILEESARSRFTWTPGPLKDHPKKDASTNSSEAVPEHIRKTANRYEKRLLSGVVTPSKITTTFAHVHAPEATTTALKTLTSLSLLRPDAFKYGVLKADAIPGLLLYGPPGTGKTLLAKAVAKESGASVLSVSGADVNHMYVGESEKSVAAIFSLARKLSPCVVFVDEADAILGSRSQARLRPSHRDTINQFLREWDGMDEANVFLMVATNRPFDLDDAVLRRLPRRLLVDLPTEKDREAILRIHLRDEQLSPEISLTALAAKTPFYSGSDLKNLAVAAALACVREEQSHPPPPPGHRRTLLPRHFEAALGEISASVGEDMESLSAIRKFDEQFGDRRGRRKRNAYGFIGVERGEGDVRVRPP